VSAGLDNRFVRADNPALATERDSMKRFAHNVSTLALTLMLAPVAADAQYSEAQPGTRVRIEAPGIVAGRFEGTVLTRDNDVVRVGSPNAAPVEVPMARITSFEISRGKSRWAGVGRGAGIGLPIGLVLGLIAATADTDARTYWDAGRRDTLGRGEAIAYGALGGALWGGVIGAFVPKERWERFTVAPRTGFDSRRGRVELGLALRR
jgi:hypothetical protein